MRQVINLLIEKYNVDPQHIFYLNKEYLAFKHIKTSENLQELFKSYLSHFNIEGKVYIFLDEVQNINGWELFVNSYSQDFTNEYEIFVTGSNSNLLSGEFATYLSGRYIEFKIHPFGLVEFAGYYNRQVNKEIFLTYIESGGMPEMLHLKNKDIRGHYIESLKDTIILRDIVQRNKIKDTVLLEEVFHFLIGNIGNLTSLPNIVKYFKNRQKKTNYETLSSYVDYLKQTFIINETERYNLRGKQVIAGEKKYFLSDLSFRNHLFGIFPEDMGYLLENYIYMQLKRMGYNVFVGKLDNLEIDFIAKKNDTTIYIQVAYLLTESKTIEREFGNLLKIKDNHEKFVISMDDMSFTNFNGIKHIRPWELV